VAACSNAWVWGSSLAGIADSNPARGMDDLSFVSVVCSDVEVSVSGRSLVQGLPTECGMSKCDQMQQYPSTPTMIR
jgi:hypothetical protein